MLHENASAELGRFNLRATVDYILSCQTEDGAIPWFAGGKTDPWDMIEAAMGLVVGGELIAAQRAYAWLAHQQLVDGSWWANYQGREPIDKNHRETNFVAYIATGIWHYYLATSDQVFLRNFFPCVKQAIEFVLRYQANTGEIYWAVNQRGEPDKDALITASASIYKSLTCAIQIAQQLDEPCGNWKNAHERLGHCLRYHPECFDRTWAPKTRFSMDWFYPVLTGVLDAEAARARIESRWALFVEPSMGCRCVSDEPWVTIAESSELVLALVAAGEQARALQVFSWLHQFADNDGGYWTGYNFRDDNLWPLEKTTWTAGVVLLAADALFKFTPASELFGASVQHERIILVS